MSIKIQLDEHTIEDYKSIKMLKELGFTDEEIQALYDKQKEIDGEREENKMKIYNVHYGMNGEEHDYVIEAMSESDALTSCWRENGEGKYGSGTYIALWTEYLPDCEENRQLAEEFKRES